MSGHRVWPLGPHWLGASPEEPLLSASRAYPSMATLGGTNPGAIGAALESVAAWVSSE
ncbi:MAG: hypothetical protein ACK5RJ_05515 [Burkholderiales bacterium]